MKKYIIVIACILFPCYIAASNWGETLGFSARGMALGNGISASYYSSGSLFYNTALLGRTSQLHSNKPDSKTKNLLGKLKKNDNAEKEKQYLNEIYFGYLHTLPQFTININRFDSSSGDALSTSGAADLDFGIITAGFVFDINSILSMPEFISSCRIGLSAGIVSDGAVVHINDQDLKTHTFIHYGRDAQRTLIYAALGAGFFKDAVGIGAGAHFTFEGQGTVSLQEVQITGSGEQIPEGQSMLDLSIKPCLLLGIYIDWGKIFQPLQSLVTAASFQHKSDISIYPFETTANVTGFGDIPPMLLAIFDYYHPHSFRFGISWTIGSIEILLELQWQLWSDFTVSPTDEILWADIPDTRDIFIPRTGVEWSALSWLKVLAGFYYRPSIFPQGSNAGEINLLDSDVLGFSTGTVFIIPEFKNTGGPIHLTCSYQFQYLVKRNVEKDSPTPENPDFSYQGMCHTFMIDVSMKL